MLFALLCLSICTPRLQNKAALCSPAKMYIAVGMKTLKCTLQKRGFCFKLSIQFNSHFFLFGVMRSGVFVAKPRKTQRKMWQPTKHAHTYFYNLDLAYTNPLKIHVFGRVEKVVIPGENANSKD